jgi:hypothetical protein
MWAARKPKSCEDLRAYVDRYHAGGTYLGEATAMLAARQVVTHDTFTPVTHSLVLYVSQSGTPSSDEPSAKSQALTRGTTEADRLCKGFADTDLFRLKSSQAQPQSWDCSQGGHGVVCAFEGQAICSLEQRNTARNEICGGG